MERKDDPPWVLRRWHAEGWRRHVGRAPVESDFVFPILVVRATPRCSARHSFATWLAAEGVPDEIIGRLLGHSARSVTRSHCIDDADPRNLCLLLEAVERIRLEVPTGEVSRSLY